MIPNTCPQCGASLQEDRTCESVFNEFLVLEFTDPGYGSVHMLTVACYMIQHGKYTDGGLVWMAQTLRDYLENGKPVEQIRQQAAKETSQGKRGWKVMRGPGDPPQGKVGWSMTIVDVARRYQDAESYRDLITQWARVTLEEMQPLLPGKKSPDKWT